jgi:phage terminase large subunit
MNSFIYTTAIKKLRKLTKRIRVVPGGTSAGKTYGILPILIDRATKEEGLEISVVSESVPHLRRGALKDFLKIMKATNRYVDDRYNRTLLTYQFANGSYIEFFSADQEDKVRGPRRNILYVNECNNISFETYHQLAIRTSNEIWLDFNPSHEFWAHTELQGFDDIEWLTLTYKDNEGLPDTIVKEIEKAREKAETSDYWRNWWRVYGLGELGQLDSVIFNNWKQIDSIPKEARLLGHGIDFGYTNDPSTIISLYKLDNTFILHEALYQKGMSNRELFNICKGLGGYFVADSAEPKSIAELQSYGIAVMGAEKGPGSVMHGIQSLQSVDLLVTSSSVNLIKELRNYTWDKDRNGTILRKPIGAYDHAIDAARYIAQKHILLGNIGHYDFR